MDERHHLFYGCAVFATFVLAALCYWPGLNGPLVLDDGPNLEVLSRLADQGRPALADLLAERGGWLGSRSVSWISFWISWRIAPADVWSFKLHNVALHLLNGLLVLALCRGLLSAWVSRFAPDLAARVRWVALMICALWLLAPIQVSTVLYVVQRMTLLAGFFVLAGLVSFMVARTVQQRRPFTAVALIGFSLLVCWPLATLSKQTGALLPFLLFITDRFLLLPVAVNGARHALAVSRVITVLALAVVLVGLGRIVFDVSWVTDGYIHRDFGVTERLLSQPRVLVDYVFNVLQIPLGSQLGLFRDDFEVSRGLFTPLSTLPSLLAVLLVACVCWWQRHSRAALLLYGLSFFLVAHALEAGPFGLELYFEHRNYLPSLGLWVALGAALVMLLQSHGGYVRVVSVVCCLLVLVTTLSTFDRVIGWSSWDGIVEHNAEAHPRSVRAHSALAARAVDAGELDFALQALATVAHLGGERVAAAVAVKTLMGYCKAGREPPREVIDALARLPTLPDDPYTVQTLRWFAQTLEAAECRLRELPEVATVLAMQISGDAPTTYWGFRWMRDEAVARINEQAGYREVATTLFERARQRAPASARESIRLRIERLRRVGPDDRG